ncbi:MAG: DUF6701 domain-containing protein [Pseudomonadales bacterium]
MHRYSGRKLGIGVGYWVLVLYTLFASITASAAISFVTSTTDSGNDSDGTLTVPGGVSVDDLMLVQVTIRNRNGSDSVTAPVGGGWSIIGSQEQDDDVFQSLYYKVATAADIGANYQWDFAGNNRRYIIGMSVFSGVDTGNPIDANNAQTGMSGNSVTAPSVTTSQNDAMLVGFYSLEAGNQSFTPPAGMSEIYDLETGNNGNGLTTMVAYAIQVSSGASGDKVATASKSNDDAIGHLVALNVAVVIPGVLDHFEISHDGVAESCAEETVTITAHDNFDATYPTYTGSVTINARDIASSTNTGSWSLVTGNNPGSFVDNGDGTATYQYVAADNGFASFGYTQTSPLTINFDITDGSISEAASEDNNMIVADPTAPAGNFRDEFGGGDYRDDFNTAAYNNSDGIIDWSSNGWIETDPSGGGATGGDILITGGRLTLTGNNLNPTVKATAEREVDLTGYTSAVLRFSLQTTSVESNDISTVEVSNNGGVTWTTLVTFADDVPVLRSFSYDITPFISSNTRIRFRIEDEDGGSCCYGPSDEILEIESVEISSGSASAYANNDGSLNWAGSWQESDGDGSGTGPISIYGGELYLFGDSAAVVTMARAADLSSFSDATLRFDYQAVGNVDSSDEVLLQISAAGSGWVTLRTYTGNVSGADSISLLGYLAADTQLRFVIDDPGTGGSCCYDASDEAFVVDNVDISVFSSSSCITGPDHFSIGHAGTAVNCQAEPITITAHLSDESVLTSYTGTIALSTSTGHGDWFLSDGITSIAVGSDTGNASYTFAAGDNGSVQLLLKNTNVESLSINVADGSVTETSGAAMSAEDLPLNFQPTGFRFYDGVAATPIKTQLSGKDSDITDQGLLSDLYLQAINTNTATGACEALLVGPQNIGFTFECVNPASCSSVSGIDLKINGTSIPAVSPSTVPVPVSLDFGGNTVDFASFKLNYRDAGSIRLNAEFNLAPSGTLSGSSAAFVVRPAGLCIEALPVGGVASACASPYDTCGVYVVAGASFNLRVSAMNWEKVGEVDDAFCGNTPTPNFQLNNIALSSTVVEPAGKSDGMLSIPAVDIISGGSANPSVTFSEVGAFTFTATPPMYLGETIAASSSAVVGRFIPASFTLVSGSVAAANTVSTNFTYLGQPFSISYDLAASALSGLTTTNYIDNFAKLNLNSFSSIPADVGVSVDVAYGAVETVSPTSYNTRLTSSGVSPVWTAGAAMVSNLPLTIERTAAAEAPINNIKIGIQVQDSDGVTFINPNLDTSANGTDDTLEVGDLLGSVVYGRVFIPPVYGPEIDAGDTTLLPFSVQIFNGTNFITHTNDSSSSYGATTTMNMATISNYTGAITPADFDSSDINFPSVTQVVAGVGTLISVNRPGAGKTGSVQADFSVDSWLQFDWSGGGVANPTTLIHFGIYRGHDRIIYWRENHNP